MGRIITLTTDFGLKDPYQGAMKGAILTVAPGASIVDITHLVEPGNILEGAFVLLGACRYFPPGTIHVGVVDPGVGGERKTVLIETGRYIFVGPDNGLLSLAAREDGIKRVLELKNKDFFREEVSDTFHGRDIFGPVAAHLSMGAAIYEMGQGIDDIRALDLPRPVTGGGDIKGEVIYIDSFGNLITNIRREEIPASRAETIEVLVKGFALKGIKRTYSMEEQGSPLALIGSTGFLEIAVNSGSASRTLGAHVGESVLLRTG